ncbi:hypothetical protein [Evansella clarkii]|uniref:hypothetical protein n=1 Tax=Evansella clarkii TaxID=79879 RepID=UPI0009965C54|nr:hypothetical protein [Evansella clarkii]
MSLIFDREELRKLYSKDKDRRMLYIEKLVEKEKAFYAANTELPKDLSKVREAVQIHKDENILTLLTFAALNKGGNQVWDNMLYKAFGSDWGTSKKEYEVMLEQAVSPSKEIKESLIKPASEHPVKYARDISELDKAIEGPTTFDAVLEADKREVFFECKFTSDISSDTTHCTSRNQIARCIDVGLAKKKDKVEDFYFVLVTPARYKKYPGERFYYFKMEQYMKEPEALALDIPRFNNWVKEPEKQEFLEKLAERIAWVTWEECLEEVLACIEISKGEKEELKKFYKDRLLF